MLLRNSVLLFCAVLFGMSCSRDAMVKEVELAVRPKDYHGPCPAALHFVGTIRVSGKPAFVDYQWERSDGTTTPKQHMPISRVRQRVHDTWTVGSHGSQSHLWERLHVLSPTGIESPVAHVSVDCR